MQNFKEQKWLTTGNPGIVFENTPVSRKGR